MRAEILMIGTELLLGQIQDTNATLIARALADHGINLYRKTTVGDNKARIIAALETALEDSDVVLCSGGLGPTQDDITRDCVSQLLGRPLEHRDDLYEAIVSRFAHLHRNITENNKKQAALPQGARALENPNGTAPGFIVEDARDSVASDPKPGIIICMPGVPKELEAMLHDSVLPYMRERFGMRGVLHYRVLKVCGMGESRVDALMGDLINSQRNPTVGLLASPEAVRIRIAAQADNLEAAEKLIAPIEAQIHERLPGRVMGKDDDTIEAVIDRLLEARGWRLAIIESSTGGLIMQRFTAAHAKSFAGGHVIPSHILPQRTRSAALDLAKETLVEFAVESALVLIADKGQQRTHVAFATPEESRHWELPSWGVGTRDQMRAYACALEKVRRHLIGLTE